MRETSLEFYKRHFNCEHDGETVLKAANEDILFKGVEQGANGQDAHDLLVKLGIRAEMTRDEITICLIESMNLDNMEAHAVLKEEVGKRFPKDNENVVPLPSVRDKAMEIVIRWLDDSMSEAIRFCEMSMRNEERSTPETKRKGIWGLIKDVLK